MTDINIEEVVIGSMIIDNSCVADICAYLPEMAFTQQQCRETYEAIKKLNKQSKGVDILTVFEITKDFDFLTRVTKYIGNASHVMQHVGILLDKYNRALFTSHLQTLLTEALDNRVSLDSLLKSGTMLFQEIDQNDQPTMRALFQELPSALDKIEEARLHRERTGLSYSGADTGFPCLNERLTGYQPETLTIIAARPGMGKTAFMLWSAEAVSQSGIVLIFSLEMSKTQLLKRAISGKSGIEYHRLTNGNISERDMQDITEKSDVLMDSKIYIDDTPGIHVDVLIRTCRQIAKKHVVKAVFIDYLQLLRGDGQNRTQEIGYISRSLKGLSKNIYAPVIALAQLNRSVEGRSDKRPSLADLRDSGEVEQDADDIVMLYRDEYYGAVAPGEEGKMELITKKCRNGGIGTDYVFADLRHNRFSDFNGGKTATFSSKNDPF